MRKGDIKVTKEELYELLDIDSPADFQYFENLAAFLECEEELEYEHVAELVKEMDKRTLAQLIGDYFEEISDFLPESETELYGIFDNVRRSLAGMAKSCDDDTTETKLADELERFRRWYSMESRAFLTDLGTADEKEMTLRDALVCARLEALEGSKYQYDFSQCSDYPLDEYIVSFGDMLAAEDADGSED